MKDEMVRMRKAIASLTLALALIVDGFAVMLFQDQFVEIGVGILVGALTGLIGFSMIIRMSSTIELYGNPKAKGYSSYVKRYGIYTLIFALAAWRGVNIVALLVGMLLHKGAILIYVFIHRKED